MKRSCSSVIVYHGTWLSLLFIFLIDKVSGQITTVEAVLGGSVILSCSASRYEKDVFWRHDNTKTVYDIIDGKENFHDQHSAYRSRVKGFQSEFTKGNYSIRLSDVKHTDAGIYSCHVPGSRTLQVGLKVPEYTVRAQRHKFVQTSRGARRRCDTRLLFSAALLGLSVWFLCLSI
ncbi:CD276 antigen homolog isoform X2 [Neoarius graeffei]|uniref:CD276 antigen homolog isoform X2 n=1 Tax=Neoarius graeffei TaxID=443677 RepID=UPI00298C7EF5|nr:CD276 antigen homolog isoform X2 [Neoarius graeffei]XP_060767787.1 CD276 antigen homolog isoform X2 [Neoarius graeffei]